MTGAAIRRWRDCARGSAAAEFALAVPVLVLFLAGIAQLGILFAANAGLQQAVGEGARLATIYPRPADAAIVTRIQNAAVALNASSLDTPTLTHGTANGVPYVDISLSYHPKLNFVLFAGPQITMTKTRRAYTN
jgi:Flp pilus assembly protein TadG